MSLKTGKMKAVFLAALDKTTAAERTAFLDEACAEDAALRHSVEAMLKAHDQADPLLDHPAAHHLDGPSGEQTGPDDSLGFLEPPSRPDSLGRIGHYEVLEVLGRGGFGIVFRAFDESLQRVVAVKVLAPLLAASSPPRKRFVREARSSARVRHENIVQVHAVEEQPLPYLVMEFIPGETLQQRLDRTGPLETAEVVRIGRQIADGLAAAHAQGLIHRDVKPANILIEAEPNACVKITDFGLARAADDASLTQSGTIAGTPMYMSPEQAQDEKLDHRADLFSLGSVLYTMCSGRPPFRAKSTLAVLKRVAEDTPRPIQEIIPEVPLWLCDIITRLHAKKPDDRIGTAKEVADLLGRGQVEMQGYGLATDASGRGNPAPTADDGRGGVSPPLRPAIRPRFRTRRWATAAAVILMLAGGFSFTEATGVTHFGGTVIRLFSPEGTLVVEVDDPAVSVKIDGSDVVIAGAGAKEIRLKPGSYTVEASKDGQVVSRELVSVVKNGRQVVRVSEEAPPEPKGDDVSAWERSVAVMPANEQAKAVGVRLKKLNPEFDGEVAPTIEKEVVAGLRFATDHVTDVSPVRAPTRLQKLDVRASASGKGSLADLTPLKGMPLTDLFIQSNLGITDLSALKGMPLENLELSETGVSDLTPLHGMPLKSLGLGGTRVADLTPLHGMPLERLFMWGHGISDLTPLKGMPLKWLNCGATGEKCDLTPLARLPLEFLCLNSTQVTDLAPLKDTPLSELLCANTPVSDAGLAALKDCKNLTKLDLRTTKVTAAAIDELKKALPKCNIEWNGGHGG